MALARKPEAADPAAPQPIRAASTLILTRHGPGGPEVLMGQRGATAAFMPNKFVFPGGAVDASDALVPFARPPDPVTLTRLSAHSGGPGSAPTPAALIATAIRELWEEAGLALARPGTWPTRAPKGWRAFAAGGRLPDAGALHLVARAITPPGRPRRFDARFFAADAARLLGDPDDFGLAEDELRHLQWLPIQRARTMNLPSITLAVLDHVAPLLPLSGPPPGVPFYDNSRARERRSMID